MASQNAHWLGRVIQPQIGRRTSTARPGIGDPAGSPPNSPLVPRVYSSKSERSITGRGRIVPRLNPLPPPQAPRGNRSFATLPAVFTGARLAGSLSGHSTASMTSSESICCRIRKPRDSSCHWSGESEPSLSKPGPGTRDIRSRPVPTRRLGATPGRSEEPLLAGFRL